jgi:crotonobetainyl-CoA:carnitine CoA-transferase CaiB-like acyl-CoA transferase
LSGDSNQPPIPFGIAVADLYAGAHLVQGILSCLVRRGITGKGGKVEVSLLESVLDLQFELLTTYLNDGGRLPQRSKMNSANVYLGAPYGIYPTSDGYLALAMSSVPQLGKLLACPQLLAYKNTDGLFTKRDEIKQILVDHLKKKTTKYWLGILEPADVWCSDVLTWTRLVEHEAFRLLDMVQEVKRSNGVKLKTLRCPIRIDGEIMKNEHGAPRLGADTNRLLREFAGEARGIEG